MKPPVLTSLALQNPAIVGEPIPDSLAPEAALDPAAGSLLDFQQVPGANLLTRTEGFLRWQSARRDARMWSFSRTLASSPGAVVRLASEGSETVELLNFASTDYLSLSSHPAVRGAAIDAMHMYGPHSGASPVLVGNSDVSRRLEAEIGGWLQMPHVSLFPTGWAAGFGAIVGLVRPSDYVVMDHLSHASLRQGARAATTKVLTFRHLDLAHLRKRLSRIRATDAANGILVITEGLFSMDSDYPENLGAIQETCREYEATLLVDVAHDLGSMGPDGTGQLGAQGLLGQVDIVMGSFSKTFATNGGFIATRSEASSEYIRYFGNSYAFSTALGPVQAAVALQAVGVARSDEGVLLRARLFENITALRAELRKHGLQCMGVPTPIVPVPVGADAVGRAGTRLMQDNGLLANLVEYPAVDFDESRIRLQVQADHSLEDVLRATRIFVGALEDAQQRVS